MSYSKGIEISRKYFMACAKPILEKDYQTILPYISIGLAGEGSECLGFDDELSLDHDFGPSFCIWIEDDHYEELAPAMIEFYSSLPGEFEGMKRLTTPNGQGRVGVQSIGSFLLRTIGRNKLPKKPDEWNSIPDDRLGLVINGEIFMDISGRMNNIRKKIIYERPFADRAAKLATQLEIMAQAGQYNYFRAKKRNDIVTSRLYLSKFMESSMRAWHLLKNSYAPYEKWIGKSLLKLSGGKELSEMLISLAKGGCEAEDIAGICEYIAEECLVLGFCSEKKEYLADMAIQAEEYAKRSITADRIAELEFKLFDSTEGIGGRASCQDDWGTFSKMRRSQYYSFPQDLLDSIYYDFAEAANQGRNVISEKYGIMMESADPENYLKIKDALPKLDERFVQIREAIVGIQVGMMEDFSARYKRIAGNARVIHTKDDNPFFTSYETYLRGELSTYSMDSLVLYGKMIAGLLASGKNLAEIIMTKSVHMYGYRTLDEAEHKN